MDRMDSQQWAKENPPLTGQQGRHEEVQQGRQVAQKCHKVLCYTAQSRHFQY